MSEIVYSLEQPLTDDQFTFVADSLKSSFKVSDVSPSDTALTIQHHHPEDSASIRRMTKRFLFIAKSFNKDLVFVNDMEPQYNDDPQPHLESTRQVIPVHPGFFTLQGGFLRVFKALNLRVRRFAEDLGAIEQEYPAVWPVKLFKTIDYFHEFPHQVILCAPVKEDFTSREAFARKYSKSADFESVAMDDLVADAEYGLEPAVCDCCYYGLAGRRDLPNAYYTCYNKVFRNERSGSNRLDRLTNFSVRDIMFVGQERFVLEARQRVLEISADFISALRLQATIETANDPFFANDAAMKSVFQNAHRLKYELVARLPHLGSTIAIGSVNFHLDFFGRAFDIRTPGDGIACSGCVGVGMERTAYALYCQHGPVLERWPSQVLEYLELVP